MVQNMKSDIRVVRTKTYTVQRKELINIKRNLIKIVKYNIEVIIVTCLKEINKYS